MNAKSVLLAVLLAVAWLACGTPDWVSAQETKKLALLVGVNKYAHADLNKPEPLRYAEADVAALEAVLKQSGYTVSVLSGDNATLKNIRAGLASLRKNGTGAAVVLAAFAGHGLQPEESKEAYFCPYDAAQAVFERDGKKLADWDLENTMLPLSEVLVEMKACGAQAKAIFVDACRNDPKTGRGRGFGTQFNAGDLPENLALLLSCSKGERAWEDKTWGDGHGAFFHHVLLGMRDRKGAVEGHITANSLIAYVSRAVRTDVPNIIGGGATQRPHAIINGEVDLLIDPKTGAPPLFNFVSRSRSTAEAQAAQQAWATYLGTKAVETNTIDIKLALIPAGEFTMGSTQAERDRMLRLFTSLTAENMEDESPHKVTIDRPFYLAQHEVTVGQFRRFVNDEGYKTEAEKDGEGGYGWNESTGKFEGRDPKYNWRSTGFAQTDDHPVVNVTHNDALAFCDWFSRKEGRTYRLPTEAEWEYACRAGATTAWNCGDDPEDLAQVGNVADGTAKAKWTNYQSIEYITARDGYVFTAPVGRFRANGFGLYDMHGNVWEWCSDWYDEKFYETAAATKPNPENTTAAAYRVLRGGSWGNYTRYTRSAIRYGFSPDGRSDNYGFRVLRTP